MDEQMFNKFLFSIFHYVYILKSEADLLAHSPDGHLRKPEPGVPSVSPVGQVQDLGCLPLVSQAIPSEMEQLGCELAPIRDAGIAGNVAASNPMSQVQPLCPSKFSEMFL